MIDQELGLGTLLPLLGPYTIRENRPDKGVLLEAVEEYFQPQIPQAKHIEFKIYSEAKAALSALRVGAVDIILGSTPELLEQAGSDPTLRILDSPLDDTNEWHSKVRFWGGEEALTSNRFLTEKIIVRKTLKLDERFTSSFDLSGVFWSP
jgi:hypothetical protein